MGRCSRTKWEDVPGLMGRCSLLVIDFSLLLHSSKHFCHLLLNSMQFKESFVSEMTSNKKTVSLITLEAKLIAATYIQKMNL